MGRGWVWKRRGSLSTPSEVPCHFSAVVAPMYDFLGW